MNGEHGMTRPTLCTSFVHAADVSRLFLSKDMIPSQRVAAEFQKSLPMGMKYLW